MKKKVLQFLVLILLSEYAYSQKYDASVFERISNEYVNNFIQNNYLNDKNIIQKEHCVYDKTEEMTLSCISSSWDINWTTDFDGDAVNDIVIQIMDEGLGGGGNAFGYEFIVVTLDSNEKIKATYSLFGGGKFSYALLSIDRVANGSIYATYEQNQSAYGLSDQSNDALEKLSLEFLIEGNEIKERNYKKCPIAEMNKDIFKDNMGFEIKRNKTLDDSYNTEQVEHLYLNDNTYYFATLSGCDDIDLYFTHTIGFENALENDKNIIKKTWLEHIAFLKEHTRYGTVLGDLYLQLLNFEHEKITLQKYGGAKQVFLLNNNWQCFLFVSGNKEQGSFVTLRLTKLSGADPLDFWESLKTKQGRQ